MNTRARHRIAGLALLVFFQANSWGQKADHPRFESYPADVYAGKPAPLNLRSHSLARTYRTRIREQLHEPLRLQWYVASTLSTNTFSADFCSHLQRVRAPAPCACDGQRIGLGVPLPCGEPVSARVWK